MLLFTIFGRLGVIGPVVEHPGPRAPKKPTMSSKTPLQNLLSAIRLAEGIPRDRENYRGLDEMLIQLRTAAKDLEGQS